MKNQTSNTDKYIECFDRDRNYWNNFYKDKICDVPSLFAKFVLNQTEKGKSLLDIGCGNGRDSIYFASNGLKVTGIDASDVAISSLLASSSEGDVSFICDDFVTTGIYKEKFDYCYSRFSLHAVNYAQQKKLLQNIYDCLGNRGKFFVEVRSVNDELYGKGDMIEKDAYVYNGHFRRFIRREELDAAIQGLGFQILSSEEKKDFAPLGKENPYVIRLVAMK